MAKLLHPSRSPRAVALAAVVLLAAVSAGVAIAASGSSGGARSLAAAPANTAPPRVNGVLTAGATLTASPGAWSVDAPPLTFAYQWFRCNGGCVPIEGATEQTYVLQAADVGERILVQVTAIDATGAMSPAVSSEQTENQIRAAEDPPLAPDNVAPPTIGGTTVQGSTLTAFVGQWNGFPVPVLTFLWLRCNPTGGDCAPIAGATGGTHTLGPADVATRLRVQVTATNSEGTESVTSAAAPIVTVPLGPTNTQLPAISGTPETGETLTATDGQWSGAQPIALTRQWQRCDAQGASCQPIQGATQPTYVLQQADAGARLRVAVTATNDEGSATATSQPTAVIAAGIAPGAAIPVGQVVLPNQLVISGVDFEPDRIRSRAPFTARFRVTDSDGHPVVGAQVFVSVIPFGRVAPAPITATDATGWATFTLSPTARMPLIRGYLLTFFVRATKPGEPVLAGVSNRRLVAVRIAPL
jgi:hypothetical protein